MTGEPRRSPKAKIAEAMPMLKPDKAAKMLSERPGGSRIPARPNNLRDARYDKTNNGNKLAKSLIYVTESRSFCLLSMR